MSTINPANFRLQDMDIQGIIDLDDNNIPVLLQSEHTSASARALRAFVRPAGAPAHTRALTSRKHARKHTASNQKTHPKNTHTRANAPTTQSPPHRQPSGPASRFACPCRPTYLAESPSRSTLCQEALSAGFVATRLQLVTSSSPCPPQRLRATSRPPDIQGLRGPPRPTTITTIRQQ